MQIKSLCTPSENASYRTSCERGQISQQMIWTSPPLNWPCSQLCTSLLWSKGTLHVVWTDVRYCLFSPRIGNTKKIRKLFNNPISHWSTLILYSLLQNFHLNASLWRMQPQCFAASRTYLVYACIYCHQRFLQTLPRISKRWQEHVIMFQWIWCCPSAPLPFTSSRTDRYGKCELYLSMMSGKHCQAVNKVLSTRVPCDLYSTWALPFATGLTYSYYMRHFLLSYWKMM